MTALASTDVTVAFINTWGGGKRHGSTKRRANLVSIAFGDGALTYPAGGVPMPAAAKFGLVRFLEDILIIEADSTQKLIYKYDLTNNKIRIWVPDTGAELATAPAATTLKAKAEGW